MEKRYYTIRWAPEVRRCPICYWGSYATGEEWRAITNSSRKNEAAGPKQKQHSALDMSNGESKVWCCKEQYCIGNWNARSTNQGKLDVVKQEIARVNTDILGISELKCTGMDKFNSGDHYIYYCGEEALRKNGIVLIVTKESKIQYLDAISKTTEWSLFVSKANHSISW